MLLAAVIRLIMQRCDAMYVLDRLIQAWPFEPERISQHRGWYRYDRSALFI
jgi:hypothetical protein